MTTTTFTPAQVDQLLHPINPTRVLRDGKGHSHVSQQDILAHLIRVFGFGNFDIDVLSVEPIFEHPRDDKQTRFDVCYRALIRLTVRNENGETVCHYENGSTATAQNQTRGDAHDLAYKSAISLSVKRAAIALGDQFGLSLYNKGQMAALVRGTLVGRELPVPTGDMQEGVPQQVSLGNDEIDHPPENTAPRPPQLSPPPEAAPPPQPKEPEPPQAQESTDLKARTRGRLFALLGERGIDDRAEQIRGIVHIIGRPIESRSELTEAEARQVIDVLQGAGQVAS